MTLLISFQQLIQIINLIFRNYGIQYWFFDTPRRGPSCTGVIANCDLLVLEVNYSMFRHRSSKSRFLKRKTEKHSSELERGEKIRQISSTYSINGPTPDIGTDFDVPAISDDSERLHTNLINYGNGSYSLSEHESESGNPASLVSSASGNDLDQSEEEISLTTHTSESDDHEWNSSELEDEEGWEEIPDNVGTENEDENYQEDTSNVNDNVNKQYSLREELRRWALRYHVKQNALSSLLKILKSQHNELPSDGRTLLKTCRKTNVMPFQNCHLSKICYFGIEGELHKYDLKTLCPNKVVSLKVNIDGLQISNSTGAQFWPILCQIVCEQKYTSPFPVLVYYGTSKPNSIDTFLGDFVKEADTLTTTGFDHQGERYKVRIHCLLCDAPARSFIKAIKSHSGYYSCEKCTQKGQMVLNRVVFPHSDAPKRSDNSFAEQAQEEHHNGVTPLLTLALGLVSQVPLDSMHLVYLGVVKKLILCFIRTGARQVRVGGHQISIMSEILVNLRNNIPRDFSRKPRSLKYIDRWKATELRQFCLYTSPVVLRNILPEAQYRHFLLLHVSISILTNPELSSNERFISYSEELLLLFIQGMSNLYGAHNIVYNVHNLTHLADDVRRFGCLDNFSCFPFESFLGQLKRQLRTPNRSLEQLCKRMSEQRSVSQEVSVSAVVLRGSHHRGPCMGIEGKQFRDVIFKGSTISTTIRGDSFVRLDCGKIGKVVNIISANGEENPDSDHVFLVLEEVIKEGDFYDYPCSSQLIGIFKIRRFRPDSLLFSAKLRTVDKKCIVNEDYNVAIVLNHGVY